MKKNVLITMLALMTTMTMLAGCGKPDQSQAAEAVQESTAAESTEETVEETTSSEETEGPDTINETGSTEETTPETELEESKEIVQAAETPKPTTEPVAETGSVEPTEITTSDPATSDPVQAVAEQLQAPETPAYDVTAMSATMYVKSTVNLRQGPGTEYSKVGSLNKGDQVTVTGKASNGWYQLDNGAFVSDKYLDSTAPVVATTATTPGTATTLPTEQAGDILPIATNAESFGGTSAEFVNYLNQQRAAVGLGTLAWDNGIAALAQQRAQAIVNDFSHNGAPAGYGEIIQDNTGSSFVDWFNSWNTSTTGHKENMFRDDYGSAGCGYYYNASNRRYYVVVLFKQRERTQEELSEIMNPDNMIQIGDNGYIDQGSYDALINSGIDPAAQPDEEGIKKIEEQEKMLDEGVMDRVFLD